MARNNGNNGNGNNEGNNNAGNGFNEQRFGIEEVGKLIGSAVASAIIEYENNNSNNDDYDEDGNLRRNRDGSVDKRQFNSGRGNTRRDDEDDQTA